MMLNLFPTKLQSPPHLPTAVPDSTHFSARRTHYVQFNLNTLKPKPKPNLNLNLKSKQDDNEDFVAAGNGGPLSGSDILLAMKHQKAAAVADSRKKKNKKKITSGKKNKKDVDDGFEGSGSSELVKPLMIKREWGDRIAHLEKRLLEVSEF